MTLRIVDYDTAVKLNDLGFDWPVYNAFNINSKKLSRVSQQEAWEGYSFNSESITEISAPRLALVQLWLLKNHNLFVEPHLVPDQRWEFWVYNPEAIHLDLAEEVIDCYPEYEDCLEAGIKFALNLL